MKLSMSTFVYFNYPLEETVKRLAGHGYQGVDLWGGRPHAYCEDITAEKAAKLKALIKKLGMQIPCFIPAQFRYPTCLCSPDEGVRAASVEYIKKSITASLSLGCKNVSLCPGHTLYGQGYERGMEALAASVKELWEFAGEKGATLLMEPAHAFETDLIVTVADCVRFIKNYSFDGMGIVLDTGHCFVNKESLVDCVSLLEDIPFHIHLDDNAGLSDDHKIPGEGNIGFVPFLKALQEIGYDGFLTLELGWGYTPEPDAAAYKSRKVVESLLQEAQVS